jgi:MoaA/NifB/PqqE/SkfB family radical SAM enzyme
MRLSPYKALNLFKHSLAFNKPHHVQWMLTSRCNYRCRSCNVWRDQKSAKELNTEEVKAGLNVLDKLGVMEIVLSGGNPLLRKDIDEIIDYASQRFITTIYDNGSQAVKKVDALRKADFVAISLDTLDEKKYDYLKGVHGAFKNALNAVHTLDEEGIAVGVSPTISQLNMGSILEFTRYFTEKGIPVLYCLYQHDTMEQPLFQIGREDEELEIVDKEALAKTCDALIEEKSRRKGILITEKMLEALSRLYSSGKRDWECKALQSFFMVDPLGRVAGCHLQESVASIFDLPEVWHSEEFDNYREAYRKCVKCSYMCYMFYSLHANVLGNLEIIRDQWKNTGKIFRTRRH